MLRAKKAQVCEHFFVVNTRLWRDFLYSAERKNKQIYKKHDTAEARSDLAVSQTRSGGGCKLYLSMRKYGLQTK